MWEVQKALLDQNGQNYKLFQVHIHMEHYIKRS